MNYQKLSPSELKAFLDEKADLYNSPSFIDADPVSIPHRFSKKEDIEISGLLAATIAWGNRKSIVANASRMMTLMDESPARFVIDHSPSDLKQLQGFVHRTFNGTDLQQFVSSLKHIYVHHGGLEKVFTRGFEANQGSAAAISYFRQCFFEQNKSERTLKHVSDPLRGSSAKRINMYLRWMVRNDNRGVDFGLWKKIRMSSLSIPLDIHTGNIARKLSILQRMQNDWRAVSELDSVLRSLNAEDPVRYDFALFGLGAIEKF